MLIPEENVKDLAEIPDNVKKTSWRSFRCAGLTRCWTLPWSVNQYHCWIPMLRSLRRSQRPMGNPILTS
ncbi:hypothetical protein ACFS07_21145 [Undibacterium arcticum]